VHGNVHAVCDVGAQRTIMLEGHGDEIGYIVEYIDAAGFVYLQAIGGLIVPLSAAERITILSKNGPVNGVFGVRPPHLMTDEERKRAAANELKRMPCDIGASSREEAESLVSVGDSAVVASGWRRLAGTRVSGRGFDNRCGTFAMCEAFIKLASARRKPKYNIHFVSSACEELGLIGGRLASFNVHPDIGVSCDVGHVADASPDDAKVVGNLRLGKGAIVSVGPIYHKGLTTHFLDTARQEKIAVQMRAVPKGMGNNGWALKMEHGGAAVVQIAVPLRYMHTPVEVADLKDIESVIDLSVAAISSLKADFNLLPAQP
jgi:endoglucanase